jgi:eukaryotic-like serine/threonine-protein kinase
MEKAAQDQAASGGIGLGEYRIHPERPLPGLSSGVNAAYHATSVTEPDQAFFALVCERASFPRLDIMPIVRKVGSATLVTPLAWQVIDWPPDGRRNLAIVFDKPAGGRFVNSLSVTATPISEDSVVREYLAPIVAALHALATAGVVHGAVNPANIMFGETPRRQVVLGECVSAPPLAHLPGAFLPIEAAMAAPAARGGGQPADDVFALGVTLACLLLGGDPVLGMAEDVLLRARIEHGSYIAMIADRRIPISMIDLLRGLLADDPKLRWTLPEIIEWIASRRGVTRQGAVIRRATRPFEFAGASFIAPRSLSFALSANAEAAVPIARSRDFEIWAQRALGDETGIALVKAALQEGAPDGPSPQRDAALVARICIALDWQAPVRYRDVAAAADGFGGALASAVIEERPLQTIVEAISQRVPQFWLSARNPPAGEHVTLLKLFERVRGLVDDRRLGCGVERALYELNPTLHCLSPLIEKDFVCILAGFLPALERLAVTRLDDGELIDRHGAAFVAARFKTASSEWVDGLASSDRTDRLISILRVFARLQAHGGPAAVPNLVKWVARQAAPLVESYHHRPTRQRLTKQFERVAQAGKLADLMLIIDNPDLEQRDADGFSEAMRAHAAVANELAQLAAGVARRPQQVAALAGQMASSFATIVAGAALLAAAALLV